MTDDDRRLAERLRRYEASVPDEAIPTTVPFNRRPPWAGIAAIGAAAVLTGAFIASNLVNVPNVGEASPTASQSAFPSPSASPEVSAEPTESATSGTTPSEEPSSPDPSSTPQATISSVAWGQAPSTTGEGQIYRVTAEGERFFALGSIGQDAAIWSSSDGLAWQSSTLPFPAEWEFGTDGSVYVDELATVGGRLVAIGTIIVADFARVAVWESTDGTTWNEIDSGDLREDAFMVNDLSNGPGGLVAVSRQYDYGTASAWRSGDGGHTWTEHRPPGEDLALTAVVGTGRGYLIAGAVGETSGTRDATTPRIWYSPDGMGSSWTPANLEGAGGRGLVEQLAIDGSGRWAAIGVLNDRIVVWFSTDRGVAWSVTADLGPLGESDRANLRLAGTPGGFVAVGGVPTGTWTSADGVAWQLSPSPKFPAETDALARGIGRIGDTMVVAGDASSGGEMWVSWVGRIQR